MPAFELLCLAIVVLYVAVRACRAPSPARFVVDLGLLAAASWVAEDTVIRAYGFYDYGTHWTVLVDRMPLLVALIWPIVIRSAADLARGLHARVALVAAAIVLADASLIEPVAVHAGLWSWSEPGLFAVPPIGVLGWALFAAFALWLLDHPGLAQRPWLRVPVVVLAPAALSHLALLALWWGALRWVSVPLPHWPAVGLAWGLSLLLAVVAARAEAPTRLRRADLLLRVPAALVFFGLLALHAGGAVALVAWALAFCPPYLVLTLRAGARRPGG